MIRVGLAAVLAAAALSSGCAGGLGGSASASVSVKAEIKLPIADMPTKYASWVVEAEGYLYAVNEAYGRFLTARADLAAALGVEDNADAIAKFIREAIKVKTELVCKPPSMKAGLAAECTAEANARAAGKAGGGKASGEASAGIEANCEAKASLSLSPGGCTLQTTESAHPLLSDKARWAKAEASMQIILQLAMVNDHLDGRGGDINGRGLQLHVESVTDLAEDPTLALQLNNIQAELKKGAEACGEANDKQGEMNGDLDTMAGAINDQFPGIGGSVSAR
jgi:hypothetical protein